MFLMHVKSELWYFFIVLSALSTSVKVFYIMKDKAPTFKMQTQLFLKGSKPNLDQETRLGGPVSIATPLTQKI